MNDILDTLPPALRRLRPFPMDGALLLFDRETGWNVLCDGPEAADLRQQAPRVVQFGITNRCNLACHFCSRDLDAQSRWTAQGAFTLLRDLSAAGVLEVAFGGGEPLAFPDFIPLVQRLYAETPLAISLTTNGLLLTPQRLDALRPCIGQVRLSMYENNRWPERVAALSAAGVRFGVNYLVTPQRLATLTQTIETLCTLGCRDILLLSYNGQDRSMHLSKTQTAALSAQLRALLPALAGRCDLKLDVCWGNRLPRLPRLFSRGDCGAGRDFLVITSDRAVMPCSFHHHTIPFDDAAGVLGIWRALRPTLSTPARAPGCARTPGFGLALEAR